MNFELNINRVKDNDSEIGKMKNGFGSKSGFFLSAIEFITVMEGVNGSKTLNFKISDPERTSSTIANLRLTNNDGSQSYQAPLLDKLMIVLGLEKLSTEKKKVKLYSTEEEYDIIKEIQSKAVIIQIEKEWYKWNGKLNSRNNIKNFFRNKDYATAKEILEAKDFGKYFNSVKDNENFNKIKYSNTNEEEVKYFLQHKELPKEKSFTQEEINELF